jgi:putative membrane-bound dehydrogenase-like protein
VNLARHSFVLLTFLGTISSASAQKFDINSPQSPAKPAPKWLKIIDQGQNDPRLKGYLTPEGLKVEIVADFPVVMNPVGMTFAEDGTPHVLEWLRGGTDWNEFPETFTYKDGTTRKVVTMKKFVKDVVKVLHDTKKQGVYDKAEVILKDELPSSILLHDGWLYLSGRGTVRRFRQSKQGGPYDIKEIVAQGFCGFHHHQVSGMTLGNDGWLYITSGDDDNYVEGSDGSRATVLRTGAVFRCRPDGSRMETYSIGYRNPYRDVSFDTAFNMFHADNDNEDGSKFTGCRLMHVAEGSDFGWRLRVGARCCEPDHQRGAVYGELPGKMPPMLKTGRGAPAGLLIYNDTFFPETYRGLLYYPDVFRKLIRAYRVEPKGSTFEVVEEFEFMKSDDPLFRPCQMVLGPDGAIYICDWRTDSGGAGRLSGDGQHGRIYRVSWAGTKDHPALPLRPMDSWARIGAETDEELLKNLSSENFSDRQVAQRHLVKRGPQVRPALLKLLANTDEPLPARMAALGALQSFWNDEVSALFIQLLDDASLDLRRLAADGLALNSPKADDGVHQALLQHLADPEPAVRRAVALAMGRVGTPGAEDSLTNALSFFEGDDLYLYDGVVRALERLGKRGIDKLLSLAASGVDKDAEKAVQVFLTLRTLPAAEAIPTLLGNPHLTVSQRASLVRSYGNYLLDPPLSLDGLVDYLDTHKEGLLVQQAAAEVMALPGTQRSDKVKKWLLKMLDGDPALGPLLIKAIESVPVTEAGPRLVPLVGDASRPAVERVAVLRALRILNEKSAVPDLQKVLEPKSGSEPVAVQLEALRTLAALENKTAQQAAQNMLDSKEASLQSEAVQVLGTQPEGAKLIGERLVAKQLPAELLPPVTDALRRHAPGHPELTKLLTEVMKGGLLLSLDKAQVERVERLVRTNGNPQRGKNLYLNHRVLACVTCHRLEGLGGNVGPDLTRIWETQSVEKIMESIIEPSKEIKEGYQTYVATTTKGQVFTGLKVSQTPQELVLRDANAKEIRILAADLEEVKPSPQSLMPDNVIAQLTFDQFIDLVAFLKDRASQESLQGIASEFWVVGPFGGDLQTAYAPELNPNPSTTYATRPGAARLSWKSRQTDPSGLLSMRSVLRPQSSAYALTQVFSPATQKVRMLLGSDDPMKVWLNGAIVHTHGGGRKAAPDQDQVPVTLKEGWNSVLIKVVSDGPDHELYVRFAGGQGVRVARDAAMK